MNLKNLFEKKDTFLSRDEIAELLKLNPEALSEFERVYKESALDKVDDNFFNINAKQASKMKKETQQDSGVNREAVDSIVERIVSELVADVKLIGRESKLVTRDELEDIPLQLRPQLTSTMMKLDLGGPPSYIALLTHYKSWLDTGNIMYYHMFRQGLDILDLDPVTYEMLGMNENSMGYWLPTLVEAVNKEKFFKIPKTTIVKVPLPILQLTRLDYQDLTPATLKIVNDFCMEVFNLDVNKSYFIKTGTFSSKFDFRNALVTGPQEVRELGEYLLFIHYQALQMASPLNDCTIYGVSTTNEWVVREFIEDLEDNPTIYKGMPLHTEYRVFVDFDNDEILGISPYWREDVMKQSFNSNPHDNHKKHDYVMYKMHEEALYKRYNDNKDKIVDEIKKLMKHMTLKGQWSIDVMQNKDDFYVIDLALAMNSALNDVVEPSKLRIPNENWLPRIEIKK